MNNELQVFTYEGAQVRTLNTERITGLPVKNS